MPLSRTATAGNLDPPNQILDGQPQPPFTSAGQEPRRCVDKNRSISHISGNALMRAIKSYSKRNPFMMPAADSDISVSPCSLHLACNFRRHIAFLFFVLLRAEISGGARSPSLEATLALLALQQENKSDQLYYAKVHPYLEEPLNKLVKQIPELKKIQPAPDQSALPGILEKVRGNVDDFFRHIVDLIAQEEITQERLSGRRIMASERVHDAYLILRRGNEIGPDLVEYRMDADGNPINPAGLNRGYLVTSGFALSCNYFSTDFLPESTFRYLGSQKLGTQDTYVVAFAQKPGEATHFVSLTERGGMKVNMLMQGIAWVDKSNFQIIRLRTDLLAPHPEIALERQTTEVTFSKVQFLDLATPFWLPEDVNVSLEVHNLRFHNKHHYTGYRHYRVSVKMLPPK